MKIIFVARADKKSFEILGGQEEEERKIVIHTHTQHAHNSR